jgi:YD repeat-containing protein
VQSPDGGMTTYVRDVHENPVVITDPLGHTTSYAYDAFGDVTQVYNPDGSVVTYAYDPTYHLQTLMCPGPNCERTFSRITAVRFSAC